MQTIDKAAKGTTTTNPTSAPSTSEQGGDNLIPLLDREARRLAKMRARGKNNDQIIDWLRNRGVNATVTGLHAYWQHLAEQQAKQTPSARTQADKIGNWNRQPLMTNATLRIAPVPPRSANLPLMVIQWPAVTPPPLDKIRKWRIPAVAALHKKSRRRKKSWRNIVDC
jgi:hypothetical protein